jgi:pentatricopeptide repeat protein
MGWWSGRGSEFHTYVHIALTNMYIVCCRLLEARNAIDEMPVKNVVSWNVMITGFATWGEVEYVRLLFEGMPCRNVVSLTGLIDGYTPCLSLRGGSCSFLPHDGSRY